MPAHVVVAGAARAGAAAGRGAAAGGRAGGRAVKKGAEAGARVARKAAQTGARGAQKGARAGARGARRGVQAGPRAGRPGARPGRVGSHPRRGSTGWDRLRGNGRRGHGGPRANHRPSVVGPRGHGAAGTDEAGAGPGPGGSDPAAAAALRALRIGGSTARFAGDLTRLAGRTLRGRPKLRRLIKKRLDEARKKKGRRRLSLLPLLLGLIVLIPLAIGAIGAAEDDTPPPAAQQDVGMVEGIPYAEIFNETAALGIDPRLVAAVAWQESIHFDPDVIACRRDSPAGAKGIMQFMPGTARGMGVDPCDPASAIPGGARYLLTQYERFGTWELALAAYNAGPGTVAGCHCVPRNGETEGYVPAVMAKWEEYKEQFPSGDITTPGAMVAGDYALPLEPRWYQQHRGWFTKPHHDYPAADIPVPTGTPVFAAASGRVVTAPTSGKCGIGVVIDGDDGVRYIYCHGSDGGRIVRRGQRVNAGQLIMHSASTGNSSGPHLHFGIRVRGQDRCPQPFFQAVAAGRPVDPATLPASGCSY